MGGFQPLFGGVSTPRETTPADPGPGPRPSAEGGAPAGGAPPGSASAVFTPLFGGPTRPAGSPTPGFTPLDQALGQAAAPQPAPPAPVDLDVVIEEARAEGRVEAQAEAEAALAEMQATVDALAPALDELATLRTATLRRAADDVAALVLQISRKVIGDSLAVHPDALAGVVHGALEHLPEADEVRICVAPDDVPRVRDAVAERYEDHVHGDATITAGCRVEARHARVDATLDAALEGVAAAIDQWRESMP